MGRRAPNCHRICWLARRFRVRCKAPSGGRLWSETQPQHLHRRSGMGFAPMLSPWRNCCDRPFRHVPVQRGRDTALRCPRRVQRRNSFDCQCRLDIRSARYYAGGDGAARHPYHRAKTHTSGTVALRSAIRPPVLIAPEVLDLLANKKRASYDARQPKQPNVTSLPPEGLAGGAGW